MVDCGKLTCDLTQFLLLLLFQKLHSIVTVNPMWIWSFSLPIGCIYMQNLNHEQWLSCVLKRAALSISHLIKKFIKHAAAIPLEGYTN